MTLAVVALFARGPTTLTGIASWRVKETDRIAAMATELRKLGAAVDAGDDRLTVSPPPKLAAGDHRHLRRPSDGDVLFARGAGRRGRAHPRSRVRAQDVSRLLRRVRRRSTKRRGSVSHELMQVPVVTDRRPGGVGQGHDRRRALRKRSGSISSTADRSTGWWRLKALEAGVAPEDEAGLADDRRATSTSRFADGRIVLDGRDVTDRIRREDMSAARVAGRGARAPCVRHCSSGSAPSVARRASWPTGATWAPWSFPTRRSRCF